MILYDKFTIYKKISAITELTPDLFWGNTVLMNYYPNQNDQDGTVWWRVNFESEDFRFEIPLIHSAELLDPISLRGSRFVSGQTRCNGINTG